jgi:hypothetical protein
MPELLLRRL